MLPCQLVSFGDSKESSSSPSTSSMKGPIGALSWPSSLSLTPTPSLATASTTSTSSTSVSKNVQNFLKSAGTRRRLSKLRKEPSLPLPLRRPCKNPHQRFAAFVAILLLHLNGASPQEKNTKYYKLSIQAKALVAECCRRNQMGDANFTPLQDSLSERLRGLVGVQHWDRALHYLQTYLARHHGFCLRTHALDEDRRLLHYR